MLDNVGKKIGYLYRAVEDKRIKWTRTYIHIHMLNMLTLTFTPASTATLTYSPTSPSTSTLIHLH